MPGGCAEGSAFAAPPRLPQRGRGCGWEGVRSGNRFPPGHRFLSSSRGGGRATSAVPSARCCIRRGAPRQAPIHCSIDSNLCRGFRRPWYSLPHHALPCVVGHV